MNIIINLTQHPATPEQVAAGVVDLPAVQRTRLCALLTFETLPTLGQVDVRARAIVDLLQAHPATAKAMIGGAPYLMAPLERHLARAGVRPVYAFSTRESVESLDNDGNVKKTSVFRHAGFI